mgnify:CR=1 FL=1
MSNDHDYIKDLQKEHNVRNDDYKKKLTTYGQHAENDYDLIEKTLININRSKDFSNKTCVDLGCGDGFLMKIMSNRVNFKFIDGVEINKFAIDSLNNDKKSPFNELYNVEILKFEPKIKYDYCIFTEVLEHLYDDEIVSTIEKLKSIAKNIIITTPDPASNFQLGFYLGELKEANKHNYEIKNLNEFRAIESAVHKSTVMRRSMRMAGFKNKTMIWEDNNIHVNKNKTVLYYGKSTNINPQRINHYGLQSGDYIANENSDFIKIYKDILIDSAQFFPKFNKRFNLIKFIKHHLDKFFRK